MFFIQKREGYRGKIFECIKFRTMVPNSMSDTKMADDNDDRLTKFRKFLRLSSLDEMTQFIKVFFGDMYKYCTTFIFFNRVHIKI